MAESTSHPIGTRDRLLDATVALLRAKGPAASGTKEILDRAAAPRGSFYFHFPDGKDQLVLEAVDRAAAATLAVLVDAMADDHEDPAVQITAVFDAIAAELLAEDYVPGCAVGATTLETSATSVVLQPAVGAAFRTWIATLTARLADRGIEAGRAATLADAVVAGMEGATMLARAQRTTAPLRHTAQMLALAITASASAPAAGSPARPRRSRARARPTATGQGA